MRYFSVCSGIEAATAAWAPLGWAAAAFAEIEKFPSAVLAFHYPGVPNLGDITKINGADFRGKINVLVGGTPCQSFSVAGLRGGLDDERGNLALEFVRIADESNPDFVVWENVPGILSDRGNAFGCFLAALAGEDASLFPPGKKWANAGYVLGPRRAIAWRVLDAQYFGLAQRRRRVFLVACPGGGADPREILFECESLRRDTPPSREAQTEVAGTLEASVGRSRGAGTSPGAITQALTGRLGGGGPDDNKAQGGFYVAEVAPSLQAGGNATGGDCPVGTTVDTCESLVAADAILFSPAIDGHDAPLEICVAHTLRAEGCDASEDGTGRQNLIAMPINTQVGLRHSALGERTGLGIGEEGAPAFTLQGAHGHAVAIAIRGREGGCNVEMRTDNLANTILTPSGGRVGIGVGAILRESSVRRLTPTECEALQGFPCDYTAIPWRKKPASKCPDGPRYKALGNSMAVPVMRWIGERIAELSGRKIIEGNVSEIGLGAGLPGVAARCTDEPAALNQTSRGRILLR